MLKKTIHLFFVIFLVVFQVGCNKYSDIDCTTYEEPDNPNPISTESWNQVSRGLHASIGSTDERYAKYSVPNVELGKIWQGAGWQGERVSAQMVLWAVDSIARLTPEFSDFISSDGEVMPAKIAKARFVRYVITDEFAGGCGYRKPEDFAASLSADVLDTVRCFCMEAQTTRPIWISFDIPANAKPGNYESILKLRAKGEKTQEFEFHIEVLPQTLPLPVKWKFHLDLWQNPFAVARVYGVELWSEGHWKALKPVMTMLADAGQKVITASINKRPWGGQTKDPFDSMIGWTKMADGTWTYDFSVFDRWVEFMMGLGIREQINCYTMVPWGNKVYYFDSLKNDEVEIEIVPGTKEYEEIWTPFLKTFYSHLQEKGWDKITRIAMDERAPKEMKAMLNLLDREAPELSVALADNHKSYKQYPDQLKDLCVSFGSTIDEEDLEYRNSKGYISTFYTSCSHGFPNIFTFSPPAEAHFIGWHVKAAGLDGYLRWAYCSWVQDPLHDSRFRAWPAGDTYFVYPGPRSSIRFERLREGIQDAEKIRILREQLSMKNDTNSQNKLQILNQVVSQFDILERSDDFEDMLSEARKKINELSRK